MAVSVNWGFLFGGSCNTWLIIWGPYEGPWMAVSIIWGSFLGGVLAIKSPTIWGLHEGPCIFGNSQVPPTKPAS